MKDIQYFLSEEEKYLASSQAEPELVWNEELEEFGFSYDPLSFLGKKPFQSFQHNNGKSSVSCPLKPSDSAPLKHSTMPP